MTQDDNQGAQPPQEPPRRGSMRFQDDSTQARQPSLAEQRARQQAMAEQERQEVLQAEAARAAEKKSSTKKKILIGTGVTVGLVGLVATFYTVAKPDEVTAVCATKDTEIVQDDQNCDENYVRSHGGYSSGGFFFMPIVGGGYNSYRYNYGGSGQIGQRVSGGSYTAPPGANVSTKSGKSVQRGGFGISGKSGSSGKSGGS
ncbi:hypothetical protein [Amycolatopsis sp. WAC 01375]|uniref:hypothetical protein n=1 Tax=Amycolatopsis sp. WAC 01375 TaxID=2203194 RepID=UPI001F237FA9|nr:hypothetical protein [Amycolatopsis sp. WAC 01375]